MSEYTSQETQAVVDAARAFITARRKFNQATRVTPEEVAALEQLGNALDHAVAALETVEEGPIYHEPPIPERPHTTLTPAQTEIQNLEDIPSTLVVKQEGETVCEKHDPSLVCRMCSACVDLELRYAIQLEQRVQQLLTTVANRDHEITRLRTRVADLLVTPAK